MSNDSQYMKEALVLARRGLGQVAPNPAVGCIIVRDGRIAGRGRTHNGGRPHAETVALADAGLDGARDAVAYVTLEPCAHFGKTPPCADALVTAGVRGVVSALEDPDPRVAGQGHQRLRDAGIDVVVGVEAASARAANIGYFTKVEKGRPFVQLKLAVSTDWKIAAEPGRQSAVTGTQAQVATHWLRAQADAVLVGAGTWKADDPRLTCRLEGLEDRSPIRIVLDARGQLPLDSKLALSARNVPVWVVAGEGVPASRRQVLQALGIRVVRCPEKDGRIDLAALLLKLGDDGLTRLLVEGGGQVAQSLVGLGLADELIVFQAAKTIGAGGVPAFGSLPPEVALSGFDLASEAALGADRRLTYRAKRT